MITTIVLKILLIIILVIVILLHFSVTVYVSGGTGGEFVIKAKYLGITLYPRSKKEKKQKKKKKKKDEAPDDEAFEDAEPDAPTQEEAALAEEKPEPAEEVPADGEEAPSESSQDTSEDAPEEEEKPSGKKKRRKKEKKEKTDEDGEKKESKLDELKRKWEFIKPYLPPAWKYSKKLLKAIRIEDVKINIDTGKEDAAESATFYGKLQAALFNTLNLLAMIFTLKVSEANVNCLFNEKRLDAQGEATVRLRPSTAIAIAFCLLWCCGKIFIPYKLRQRRERKKAEKEAKQRPKTEAVTEG